MLVVEPWWWTMVLGTVGVVPILGLGPMGTEVGGGCSGAGLDEGCSMGLQGCSIDTIKGMSVGSRGGLLPSMDRSMERPGELVLLSSVSGTFPSLTSFFNFIRRFWNQILICLSVSPRVLASSVLRPPVRKWLKWNSFSSSRTCFCEYTVRIRISSDLGIACCAWPWAWPRAAKSAALGVKGGMPGIPPSIPPGMRLLRGTSERAPWEGGETPPREGGREPLFLTTTKTSSGLSQQCREQVYANHQTTHIMVSRAIYSVKDIGHWIISALSKTVAPCGTGTCGWPGCFLI